MDNFVLDQQKFITGTKTFDTGFPSRMLHTIKGEALGYPRGAHLQFNHFAMKSFLMFSTIFRIAYQSCQHDGLGACTVCSVPVATRVVLATYECGKAKPGRVVESKFHT